jgi:hypothetical protein
MKQLLRLAGPHGAAIVIAVACASILRLNAPIALLATVFGTAATPFYIPALAALLAKLIAAGVESSPGPMSPATAPTD